MKDIPQGFYFRESDHSYFLNGKRMTGCTTILSVIAKPALIDWAARMAVAYVRENLSYKRLKILRKGFVVVKEKILDEASKAHTKKKEAGGAKGTDLHAIAEEYVKHSIEKNGGNPSPSYVGTEPISKFIAWAQSNEVKFIASEAQLYSEKLFVAGTCDLIFEKEGKRYVGDIKTFKKLWDRTPMLQCAGYALMSEEMGEPAISGYCILRLSENGEFEERWSYDTAGDTRGFLAAVELYRTLANWK